MNLYVLDASRSDVSCILNHSDVISYNMFISHAYRDNEWPNKYIIIVYIFLLLLVFYLYAFACVTLRRVKI